MVRYVLQCGYVYVMAVGLLALKGKKEGNIYILLTFSKRIIFISWHISGSWAPTTIKVNMLGTSHHVKDKL